VYFAQPAKGLAHRALADIIESVRELAYYRKTLFAAAPGPSSDQAQSAAADVVGGFAALLAAAADTDGSAAEGETPAASGA
jgi:oligoribonuclease